MSVRILVGDCRESLAQLGAGSVQCCVTSPPYFGLRDYGTAQWEGGRPDCDHMKVLATTRGGPNSTLSGGQDVTAHKAQFKDQCGKCNAVRVDRQLGLESSPAEYVEKMVAVFREVKRVLRDDGTLWLNIGDSYNSIGHKKSSSGYGTTGLAGGIAQEHHPLRRESGWTGAKHKDLIGIPWMLAFALRADGWYLRSDIIWHKPNPMPESVTDRPTKSHEYLFLLAKSERYFYDAAAIQEEMAPDSAARYAYSFGGAKNIHLLATDNQTAVVGNREATSGRNKRTVWTIATQPYSGAHFATFPPALVEPCIKAGSSDKSCEFCGMAWERQTELAAKVATRPGKPIKNDAARNDSESRNHRYESTYRTLGFAPVCQCRSVNPVPSTVLDPFGGAGTTGLVADRLNRNAILCELNPDYAELARKRIYSDNPLFTDVA